MNPTVEAALRSKEWMARFQRGELSGSYDPEVQRRIDAECWSLGCRVAGIPGGANELPGGSMSRPCKKCKMPIEFIEGPAGKPIPVQKVRTVYKRTQINEAKPKLEKVNVGIDAYVSHFETCPYAKEFSKR